MSPRKKWLPLIFQWIERNKVENCSHVNQQGRKKRRANNYLTDRVHWQSVCHVSQRGGARARTRKQLLHFHLTVISFVKSAISPKIAAGKSFTRLLLLHRSLHSLSVQCQSTSTGFYSQEKRSLISSCACYTFQQTWVRTPMLFVNMLFVMSQKVPSPHSYLGPA